MCKILHSLKTNLLPIKLIKELKLNMVPISSVSDAFVIKGKTTIVSINIVSVSYHIGPVFLILTEASV